MELKEIIEKYYGKTINITDTDGDEFTGLFCQYEYAVDDPDERDLIAILVNDYYIEFPVEEIEAIEVA